jgi:lipoate-protein ligase A
MRKDDVTLSRRITGGGAVYHDLGNTCFSFLTPYHIDDPLDYKSVNEAILIKAFQTLGVDIEASGRNDLTYKQKKVNK